MKRLIRNISILTIFLFVLSGIVIPKMYGDRIKKNLSKNLTSSIKSDIEFEKLKFSIWDQFPYASVSCYNLIVSESTNFSSDTLLFAKNAFVKFNLIEIFSDNFKLKNINIENAKIFIKFNNDNDKNFDILSENKETKKTLSFNKISFQNTNLNYNNENLNINFKTNVELINLNFEKGLTQNMNIDFKSFFHHFSYNNKKYIQNKNLIFKGDIKTMSDSFEILKAEIKLEGIKSDIALKLSANKYLDFTFKSSNQKIKDVINNTPEFLKEMYSSFTSDGEISFNGKVNGDISLGNPNLEIDYKLDEVNFKIKENPFLLKHLSCNGSINNGIKNIFESSSISFENFKAFTNSGNIWGDFTVSNFNQYYLLANLNYDLGLKETNHYSIDSPFFEMQGKVKGNLDYNGAISFDNNTINKIIKAKKSGSYSIINSSFYYKNNLNKIFIDSAYGFIENHKIEIKEGYAKVGESLMNFSGDVLNLFSYIHTQKPKINIKGELKSSKINYEDLLNKNDIIDTNTITELPDYLEANISLDVENFIYDKLIVKNIKGLMLYKDLAFSTDNVEANTLTGSISLNGKFYQKEDNSFKLSINSKFEDINIKTLFYCFNNFNQEYLKYENLDGKINSQFMCNTELDNKFKFISDKFQLSSKLTINEGELIDFQPMEKLSKFVSLEDLKHIKFSTLKNDIEIKDEIIKIPSMEIKSNALSMIISGYHNFNLEYNYKIKMLLGQILAKTFKSNNIDYNNDELITNVQLRMSGDEDNFDIKFEKLKIKEHIKKGIKQEVKTIKDIIKEDIIDKKQEIVNDDEIEIEWDDNF